MGESVLLKALKALLAKLVQVTTDNNQDKKARKTDFIDKYIQISESAHRVVKLQKEGITPWQQAAHQQPALSHQIGRDPSQDARRQPGLWHLQTQHHKHQRHRW